MTASAKSRFINPGSDLLRPSSPILHALRGQMGHKHANSSDDQVVINADDAFWEHLSATEPYWTVLAHERFKLAQLTPERIEEFYDIGERQVTWILDKIRAH